MRHTKTLSIVAVLALSASCGAPMANNDAGADSAAAGDIPPSGATELAAWIQAGSWRSWKCEAAPHGPRGNSPHGMNRICQNSIVTAAASGSGDFPVGAAFVKEIYDAMGSPMAVFVDTRRSATPGAAGWQFFMRGNDGMTMDNAPFCATCHQGAPRDFSFTIVP